MAIFKILDWLLMSLRTISVKLLALVMIASSSASSWAQLNPWFKDLTVSIVRNPAPGYYFIAPNAIDSFSVTDNSGKNMHRARIGQHAAVSTFGDKWYVHFTTSQGDAAFVRRNKQLQVIDTLRPSGGSATDFHEGRIVSDTSYIILGTEIVRMDLSGVVPGGHPNAAVMINVIQERTFSGTTLFSWRSIDHIPVTDAINQVILTGSVVDYIHINSVFKDNDGNYLVSCRHTDEVIKINRQTGAVMWRLGGSNSKNNQFAFQNDNVNGFVGFSHQHTVSRTSAGTILIFDNGLFKPAPQYSRVVEYEVDEVARTAKRVFQYRPTPDILTPTMGSVEELENGNLLIGYGSGSTQLVAQEINRDGVVEVQIDNMSGDGFTPYRVHKSTFLMTGVFKRVTTSGNVSFSKQDSTTHLSVALTNVVAPTSIVAERHWYAPHAIAFAAEKACGVIETRWVFRAKEPERLSGSMIFDLGSVPGLEYPELATLYHRPSEGAGSFTLVQGTYSESTKKFTVPKIENGEYAIGYISCLAPYLIEPRDRASEVPVHPTLSWSESIGLGEYQVEVATDPGFAAVLHRFHTTKTDTLLPELPYFTTLFWRVRSKTKSGFGPWSQTHQFRTQLGIPEIETPKVERDTVVTMPGTLFEWASAKGATRYRVQVTRVIDAKVVIDTIILGLAFSPGRRLEANTAYTWTVRALYDTIVGTKSEPAFFVTALQAPQLHNPIFDASDVPIKDVTFSWTSVPGALRYRLTLMRLPDSTVFARDSSTGLSIKISALPLSTRFAWTVSAVGKYGPGEASSYYVFSTSSSIVLNAARTIAPKATGNVDTGNVRFTWTPVQDAESYDIQVSTRSNFLRPEITSTITAGTSFTIPRLEPGTTYYWRVIGYSGSALGKWSDTASFVTTSRQSQALVPVTPVPGSEGVPTSGIFLYSTSSNYSSYRVLVGTDPDIATPDFSFVSSIGTCSYSDLRNGTTYFWRVIGRNQAGEDTEGPVASFTTVEAVSSVEDPLSAVISAFASESTIVVRSSDNSTLIQSVDVSDLSGRRLSSWRRNTGLQQAIVPVQGSSGVYLITVGVSGGAQTTRTLLIP